MKDSNLKNKNYIDYIKSKNIMRKVFNYLKRIKFLSIIKNNKEIQNKFNITIDDYKQYNLIEIEIIPFKNKIGKFINILNESDELYYHIYFNDSNEKIKTRYISEEGKVKKIKIVIEKNHYINYFIHVNALKLLILKNIMEAIFQI